MGRNHVEEDVMGEERGGRGEDRTVAPTSQALLRRAQHSEHGNDSGNHLPGEEKPIPLYPKHPLL